MITGAILLFAVVVKVSVGVCVRVVGGCLRVVSLLTTASFSKSLDHSLMGTVVSKSSNVACWLLGFALAATRGRGGG